MDNISNPIYVSNDFCSCGECLHVWRNAHSESLRVCIEFLKVGLRALYSPLEIGLAHFDRNPLAGYTPLMSVQIAKGPLGNNLFDFIRNLPDRLDLASARLNQLPIEVVTQIGIPDCLERKTKQVRIATELVDRYVPKDTAPREICDIELTPLVQLNYLPSSYISTIISPYRTPKDHRDPLPVT